MLGKSPGALLFLRQVPRQEGLEVIRRLSSLLSTGFKVGQQDLLRIEPITQVGLEQGEHHGCEEPAPHRPRAVVVLAGFLDVFSGTGTISFTEKTQPEYLFRTLLPQCVSIMARLP